MQTECPNCGATFDDRTTICPHPLIMPADDLARKKAALDLIGKDLHFAHEPGGPVRRIQSVGWNGMVTLHDMAGEFAPHLFVLAKEADHG
jgi:hypothetical protein